MQGAKVGTGMLESTAESSAPTGKLVPMQSTGPALPSMVRFGVFEVDVRAGEIRKSGTKIRVQEQPFQILVTLLERPDEVVPREELRPRSSGRRTHLSISSTE